MTSAPAISDSPVVRQQFISSASNAGAPNLRNQSCSNITVHCSVQGFLWGYSSVHNSAIVVLLIKGGGFVLLYIPHIMDTVPGK